MLAACSTFIRGRRTHNGEPRPEEKFARNDFAFNRKRREIFSKLTTNRWPVRRSHSREKLNTEAAEADFELEKKKKVAANIFTGAA